ncbi:MAG: preprotein translocase subunit SecE [Xanthomonadales bacterium]|nr:preprotein translocase subunit SecE [Xanthomonadales bacterium]NNL94481.1 preprotein translocase subunit SecE [Xanthomonadales bacterium]
MNQKIENQRSPVVDSLLLMVSVIMLIGGIGAYYYYQDLAITAVRVGGLIVVAVLASWVAAQSQKGGAFFRFLKEADIERRKVVWPSHQETLQTALMVLVVTILISLMLAAIDWMLGGLVRALLGGGA